MIIEFNELKRTFMMKKTNEFKRRDNNKSAFPKETLKSWKQINVRLMSY